MMIESVIQSIPGVLGGLVVVGFLLLLARLLNQDSKANVALWLKGDYAHSWAQAFVSVFDAFYGDRHWSWRCFRRSYAVSMGLVILLALLLTNSLDWDVRAGSALDWGTILVLALILNPLADYLSLLQSRCMLGWLRTGRAWYWQVLVVALDILTSALIIFTCLKLYILAFTPEQDASSFGEIVGVFSLYSIAFYSSFSTSLWAILFFLSTLLMRLAVKLRLWRWADVDAKPMLVLSVLVGLLVFPVSFLIGSVLQKDETGLSRFETVLCQSLKGDVCLHTSRLSQSEQAKQEQFMQACSGSLRDPQATERCRALASDLRGEDEAQALRLWDAACKINKDSISCVASKFIRKDFETAAQLHERACDGEIYASCNNLGILYHVGVGVAQDTAKAAQLYEKACNGEYYMGCYSLGLLYHVGEGVTQNIAKALQLYEQACNGEYYESCHNLGLLYHFGKDVTKNTAKALQLYEQACNGKYYMSCHTLGFFYHYGVEVPQNTAKAAQLYEKACDGGVYLGCHNLGFLYQNGDGVVQDTAKAAQLYAKACDNHPPIGCFPLAKMYSSGEGVAQDTIKATQLLERACRDGDPRACEHAP